MNASCRGALRNTPWALIYTLKQNEGLQLSRGSKESTIQPLKWLLQLQSLPSFLLSWWISGFQVTAPSFLWLSRRSWHPQPTPLNSTELRGVPGQTLWCPWVAAALSSAGPASLSAPVPEDLLGTMGVCSPGCAPGGVTPGATASFTVLVAGSQGVSKETEPRCPQRGTAHQFAHGCLFSLPCLMLPHSSLVLPEIISPWINDLLPILYLNICFWRNIKWGQPL